MARCFILVWLLIMGIFFTELFNYVEHCGLERHKDERGIYAPITEKHSWKSTSSPLLFRIQRHSDHQMNSYRPYQILRNFDSAPTLPYDYLYSMLFALFRLFGTAQLTRCLSECSKTNLTLNKKKQSILR